MSREIVSFDDATSIGIPSDQREPRDLSSPREIVSFDDATSLGVPPALTQEGSNQREPRELASSREIVSLLIQTK
ncbi:MAG TPA: hypothetical protein VJO53_09510 [Candidatus Acidoferrales bacterium]|nr:hypothetical protein [Candidatus Acidoferrales bacterium]